MMSGALQCYVSLCVLLVNVNNITGSMNNTNRFT